MSYRMRGRFSNTIIPLFCFCFCAEPVFGGGSGLNTLVVINQSSANSIEVGNYYCERRQVPPENVLRINWTGGNVLWTNSSFEAVLLNPLLNLLTNRHLDKQIEYVVLSMDIPFQTVFDGAVNGTTSALFYGPKTETGPDWIGITNSYSGSEKSFASAPPTSSKGYSFLAAMITGDSAAQAKSLIDQGVSSDGSFPRQPVYLEKSSDPQRNFRYWAFDNAIFNSQLCRSYSMARTNCDSPWGQTNLLGLQTGLYQFNISPNTFIGGAMADSLTSYGGIIFGPNDHTTLMSFIRAGASGSYGTVVEPAPIADKFPDPRAYFCQARGFSIAECYYQSIFEPYQGLVVAEPLAAPFRRFARGQWSGLPINGVFSGTRQLSLQWTAYDRDHPIQQVDLFVDGKYFRTLTNAVPAAGNVLQFSLNGYPFSCTVATNENLSSLASRIASLLNSSLPSNLPLTIAFSHGDRIELHAATNAPAPFFYLDPFSADRPFRFYRTILPSLPPVPILTALGRDGSGAFSLHIQPPGPGQFNIQASTNLIDWSTLISELSGPYDFIDDVAANLPRRFYRVGYESQNRPPAISGIHASSAGFMLHVENTLGSCLVEASTNLIQWLPIATNSASLFDILDPAAVNYPVRFYRASATLPPVAAPRTAVVTQTPAGDCLLRMDGSAAPYIIQVSTDLVHWTSLFTNLAPNQLQVSTASSRGNAAVQTTFLSASRPAFLKSPAHGIQRVSFSGSINLGSALQVTITKTNGVVVRLGATNQSLTATLLDVAQGVVAAINSCPALQGADGVQAGDAGTDIMGSAVFNLSARSPGLEAAAIRIAIGASLPLVCSLTPGAVLDQNLADLQPRNHLYVSAGLTNMVVPFALDTTQLGDGFHELTAVTYEGTHVRSQTRITATVLVTNSPWAATLGLIDLPATNALATATYHLQVAANVNNVTAIRLFSTGGLLNTVSNQNVATFTIDGAFLGAGLHPFYAIVDTRDGRSFRTRKQLVRFINP